MSDLPLPIQWDQGMLLTPRHFLEMGGRYEMLQQNSVIAVHPLAWGVINFEYDHNKLASGKVEITQLDAVMPDGTLISIDDEDRKFLSLDLEKAQRDLGGSAQPDGSKKKGIGVFLAIRKRREFKWGPDYARYQPSRSAAGKDSIPRLRPVLKLFTLSGDEQQDDGFLSVQLMRVSYDDITYTNDFEPPRLTIDSASYSQPSRLFSAVTETTEFIRGRIRILKRQIERCERMQNDISGFRRLQSLQTRLQSLISGLPALETLLQASRQCHPFSLYLALCSVAGHVAPMALDPEPPDFGKVYPYDHSDLLACFKKVCAYIHEAIESGIPRLWYRFTFEFTGNGFKLEPQAELEKYKAEGQEHPAFVIALLPSSEQAVDWLPVAENSPGSTLDWGRNCIISSSHDLERHQQDRTKGAKREFLTNPPDLPTSPQWALFGLAKDAHPDLEHTLVLEGIRGAIPPQRADLYVRRPRKSKA